MMMLMPMLLLPMPLMPILLILFRNQTDLFVFSGHFLQGQPFLPERGEEGGQEGGQLKIRVTKIRGLICFWQCCQPCWIYMFQVSVGSGGSKGLWGRIPAQKSSTGRWKEGTEEREEPEWTRKRGRWQQGQKCRFRRPKTGEEGRGVGNILGPWKGSAEKPGRMAEREQP